MLRIEGNKGSRVVATLLSIAAVMVAWIIAPAPASAAQGGTTTQWTVTGPQGGPFTPTQARIDITNSWNTKLRWYAIGDTSWLRIAGFNGIIKPGQTKSLSVSLQEKAAAGLIKGTYKCQIAFRVPGSGQFHSAADLILIVGDPPPPPPSSGQLAVTPPEGLTSQGTKGGTFSPLAKDYTLANRGSLPVNWKVTFDNDWVTTPGANSGTLQPNTSHNLQVRLDASQLANLPVGQHTSRVRFHDTDTGLEVTSREVFVNVKSASSGVGWTQFTPSADTRKVYVSSSKGNDGNSGLSEASPKRTVGAGMSLLRDGYPDWLLLKKGDTWTENLGHWKKSGRSASEPMLVSTYGTGARPKLRTGIDDGFVTSGGGGSPSVIRHVAVVGLHFIPHLYDGTNSWCGGFKLFLPVEDLLIEDCYIERYKDNLVFQGSQGQPHRNIRVRRSILVDNDADPDKVGHSQGVYTYAVENVLFEENLFDKIGQKNPNIYRHALYIDSEHSSGVVLRGNIISDTGSHGAQLRPGGIAEDNLFLRTPIALLLGGGESWMTAAGGVTGALRRNVILDSKNTNASHSRGWGIVLENVVSATVEDNILANSPQVGDPRPIQLGFSNDKKIANITMQRNVVSGWGGCGVRILGAGGTVLKNLSLRNNEIQNLVDASSLIEVVEGSATGEIDSEFNSFFSGQMAASGFFLVNGQGMSLNGYKQAVGDVTSVIKQVSYPNKNASVAAYHASLGKAPSHDAFIAEARQQSRDYWRPEYTAASVNNWVRGSFGK